MPIKLNWFKMLWLNSDERKALRKAIDTENRDKGKAAYSPPPKVDIEDKAYLNIFYSQVNKTIIVILKSGELITKPFIEIEVFEKVKSATTEAEIEALLLDKEKSSIDETMQIVETREEKKQIQDNLFVFRGNKDFHISGSTVALVPCNLPLPSIVAATFIEILEKIQGIKKSGDTGSEEFEELENNYSALKSFWLKLSCNPLSQSREDTLIFVKNNDVRITRNGNMILYRRIVKIAQGNTALSTFVSQEYFKIKKWKKSPKTFTVGRTPDGEYALYLNKRPKNWKTVGNLHKLYKNLGKMKENEYTSFYNKGKHIIKLGGAYKIDDKEINLDNGVCAAGGLHAACVSYNYSGFGDTPVVVLVNPSKAITVPRGETGKLRTTEMFVACVNDKSHGHHFDEDSINVFDEEYHDLSIIELEDAVRNKSFEKLKVEDNVPAIAIDNLELIKDALKSRVKQVV